MAVPPVVTRSPFEYYPGVAALGPRTATAFQEGMLNTAKVQEAQTRDEYLRQQMELARAAEGRTAAAAKRLDEARAAAARSFDALGAPKAAAPQGAGLIPPDTGQVAARLVADLQRDFNLTPAQAAGVVGNLAHESGGFRTLQEISPVVPGSRGGLGYAQWTGPRRVAFEQWAKANNLDPNSYEANYGFLRNELQNTSEGRVLSALRQAPDVATATQLFSNQYLRPGIPAMDSRLRYAQQFAAIPAAPAAAAPAAGLATPSAAPAPMFMQPGVPTLSTGGVPMTAPEDLPPVGGQASQFMVPGPTGMTPVGVPLDAQGKPVIGTPAQTAASNRARAEAQRLQELQERNARIAAQNTVSQSPEGRAAVQMMEQGRLRNDRDMYQLGLARFRALVDSVVPPQADELAAPTPTVETTYPQSGAITGAGTLPLPAGMAMRAGVGPAPDALAQAGLAPLGQAPAAPGQAPTLGQLGIRPVGQAAQPAPRPATPAKINEAVANAMRPPISYGVLDRAEVARQREALNTQQAFLQTQLQYALAKDDYETLGKLREAFVASQTRSDMLSGMEAVADLNAGNPAPLADYFYRRTGGAMQLQQNADNTFNILDRGRVVERNLTPQRLAALAREDVDYRVRQLREEQKAAAAARQKEIDKVNLEIRKKLAEQRGELVTQAALEELKSSLAKKGVTMTINPDGGVFILDQDGRQLSIATRTNKDIMGRPLKSGEFRYELKTIPFGTSAVVPTR